MSQAPAMGPFRELAYHRRAMFAIDVVDAVTLERVGRDVKVIVEGLTVRPVLNASGMHVWLWDDVRAIRRVRVDPLTSPYEAIEFSAEDIAEVVRAVETGQGRVRTVQLPPLADGSSSNGLTVFHAVVLDRASNPVPLVGASARLDWLDDSNAWAAGAEFPIRSARGTFVAALRPSSDQVPALDPGQKATVRLRVRRGTSERVSASMPLPWGKATNAASSFFWDDLYLYP